jgi:diguanylate cyclase (GGDEF)-like protein/PAS domain S-box-containing protein
MTTEPTAARIPAGAGELPDEAFRMIVDGAGYPYVVVASDGTIRYAGGSIEAALGWPPEALAGHNMAEFLRPDQIGLAIEAVAEIESIDRDGDGVPMVFGVIGADGVTRWVEIGAMPLLDAPGVGIVMRLQVWDAQYSFDEFIAALLADEPLDEVLTKLSRSIGASVQADAAAIHYGFGGASFAGASGFGVPEACLVADGAPWVATAVTEEGSHCEVPELPEAIAAGARAAGFESCWTVPVPRNEGLAPAVLTVWRRAPGHPLLGHRHMLARYARYAQLALVRTAEHQRLRHIAGHDALTGVANRAEFRDRLAHALSIGESDLAVAFCDLDDFKPVNDTYGHAAGDVVLVQVADRLRSSLRTGDELARIGGDEFTILLRNVANPSAARHVAERILATVAEPFDYEGNEVVLGLSVGIALTRPGATADDLLDRADDALYEVKRAGGNGASVAR